MKRAWFAIGAVAGLLVAAALIVHARPHSLASAQAANDLGASGSATPPRSVQIACPSAALGGELPAVVYVPSGYDNSSRRYRVVYLLHGLPAAPDAYLGNGFVAGDVATGAYQAIVVAPQGAREANSDREYLDWDDTENWPRAIAHDLTGCVDRRFRTIVSRYGRALIGLSAGGFGALNIALRNLTTFGATEGWSGYFEATDPSGLHKLDLGSPEANAAASAPRTPVLRARLASLPTFIGFYVGNQDSRFLADNMSFSAALTAAGISHRFAIYSGGHDVSLWQSHAQDWLDAALQALAAHR